MVITDVAKIYFDDTARCFGLRRMPNQIAKPMLARQNAPEIAGNDSTSDKESSWIFAIANEKSEVKKGNERKKT